MSGLSLTQRSLLATVPPAALVAALQLGGVDHPAVPFVGLGLAGLLGWGLGAWLTHRLRGAADAAARLASGDLLSPVPGAEDAGRTLTELHRALGGLQEGLRQLERAAAAASRGDLRARAHGEGELSQAFNATLDRQRRLVEAMTETTADLEISSRQILSTMREQEAASNEQAGGVEEVRRTMASLLEASRQIATSARGVHENAQRSKGSSEGIADRTHQLNKLTNRIADALTAISTIADKSDVLALNASLEGTKAGEAGKGFTLVAEEMRRLAESVMEAVRDIGELVETIRRASHASVLATEEGVKLSLETTRSAETIRLTSQQQQSGTEQVTRSMNEIADFLAATLAVVRQNGGALGELTKRATQLRELLAEFELEEAA